MSASTKRAWPAAPRGLSREVAGSVAISWVNSACGRADVAVCACRRRREHPQQAAATSAAVLRDVSAEQLVLRARALVATTSRAGRIALPRAHADRVAALAQVGLSDAVPAG